MKIIQSFGIIAVLLACATNLIGCVQEDTSLQSINSTSITKKLFTYTGPLLPSDWSLVSILNDRAVIGFNNGTARNAPISELDAKDRSFLQRLQNGTVYATPLSQAKEKISQWSSSVSSTVNKLGKSFREQLDTLLSNDKNKSDLPASLNTTLVN